MSCNHQILQQSLICQLFVISGCDWLLQALQHSHSSHCSKLQQMQNEPALIHLSKPPTKLIFSREKNRFPLLIGAEVNGLKRRRRLYKKDVYKKDNLFLICTDFVEIISPRIFNLQKNHWAETNQSYAWIFKLNHHRRLGEMSENSEDCDVCDEARHAAVTQLVTGVGSRSWGNETTSLRKQSGC